MPPLPLKEITVFATLPPILLLTLSQSHPSAQRATSPSQTPSSRMSLSALVNSPPPTYIGNPRSELPSISPVATPSSRAAPRASGSASGSQIGPSYPYTTSNGGPYAERPYLGYPTAHTIHPENTRPLFTSAPALSPSLGRTTSYEQNGGPSYDPRSPSPTKIHPPRQNNGNGHRFGHGHGYSQGNGFGPDGRLHINGVRYSRVLRHEDGLKDCGNEDIWEARLDTYQTRREKEVDDIEKWIDEVCYPIDYSAPSVLHSTTSSSFIKPNLHSNAL